MGYGINFSKRSLKHYVIIKRWGSDIEFFKIKTAFLHRLLDEYFISLCSPNKIEILKRVGERLLNLEKDESKTHAKLRRQLKELGWIAKSLVIENSDRLLASQVEAEFMMVNVIREYREVKKEVFKLIEAVKRENKQLVS